mmetsp:Transcript_16977/g.34023  ORF Transcript_16977/g.34023 Transcript_16977/m.34023 type:complete len:203 (+) Transcript_16977:632-1240(+)
MNREQGHGLASQLGRAMPSSCFCWCGRCTRASASFLATRLSLSCEAVTPRWGSSTASRPPSPPSPTSTPSAPPASCTNTGSGRWTRPPGVCRWLCSTASPTPPTSSPPQTLSSQSSSASAARAARWRPPTTRPFWRMCWRQQHTRRAARHPPARMGTCSSSRCGSSSSATPWGGLQCSGLPQCARATLWGDHPTEANAPPGA